MVCMFAIPNEGGPARKGNQELLGKLHASSKLIYLLDKNLL